MQMRAGASTDGIAMTGPPPPSFPPHEHTPNTGDDVHETSRRVHEHRVQPFQRGRRRTAGQYTEELPHGKAVGLVDPAGQ
jgi:hypothetical protein